MLDKGSLTFSTHHRSRPDLRGRLSVAFLFTLLSFIHGASSNPAPNRPTLTGIRLLTPTQAEVQWQGATEGITLEYAPSLNNPAWQPMPGTSWPIQGSSWTGNLPSTGRQLYLRLSLPGSPAAPDLLVYDAEKLDAGFLPQDAHIRHNPGEATEFEYLGRAYQHEAPFSKGYRIVNDGSSALSLFALELKGVESTVSVSLPNPGQTLPLEIPPGTSVDIQITANPEIPGLHTGRLELVSNDPAEPLYAFNLAAVIGEPRTLLCAGDNDPGVDPNFSCVGKPKGTLCGATEDGKSRVCHQDACVLLGDANTDGVVDRHDIASYLTETTSNRPVRALDLNCDGEPNGNARERQMFANLLSDTHDFEAYNSRAVEGCTGRDLFRNLAAYPEKGLGYAFTNGYIDLEAMQRLEPDGQLKVSTPLRYKEPVLVCLDSLGVFDTETGEPLVHPTAPIDPVTGRRTPIGNEGKLTGYFLEAIVAPRQGRPVIPFVRTNNDFRVYFQGGRSRPGTLPAGLPLEPSLPVEDAHLWAAAVQIYYDITRHRNVFLNKRFVRELRMLGEFEKNVLIRQHRPDLTDRGTIRLAKHGASIFEGPNVYPGAGEGPGCRLYADFNSMGCNVWYVANRELADEVNFSRWNEILNIWFLPGVTAADYFGLVAFWLIADRGGFRGDSGFDAGTDMSWPQRVSPSLNDGLSAWEGYRLAGLDGNQKEVSHIISRWPRRSRTSGCSDGRLLCTQFQSIDNVCTYNGNQPNPSTYPFYPGDKEYSQFVDAGPTLHDLFFPAILYDLSQGLGLGDRSASLILWKTLGYITNAQAYPMQAFAADLLRASRDLFPASGAAAGQARFEDGWVQILSARGMPLHGRDFRDNLLPAARDSQGRTLASSHPLPQKQELGAKVFETGVFEGEANAPYMALQFHPFCRLGPCDSFEITNGSYDGDGRYQPAPDAPYRQTFEERQLANRTVLVPGRRFAWKVNANRCDTNLRPDFRMDVAAFGFRVVDAKAGGFGITTGKTIDNVTVLQAIDPSDRGQYRYQWRFQYRMTGREVTLEGSKVFPRDLYKGPVSLEVTRSDGSHTHSLRYLTLGGSLSRPAVEDLVTPTRNQGR